MNVQGGLLFVDLYCYVCHAPTSPKIEKGEDEHPHQIDEVPVQAGDLDDLVVALPAREKATSLDVEVSPQTFRAIAIRKITPIVTWVP